MEKKLKQGTLCVQAGYKAKNGEPIELPIIQSTTFKYDDSDEMAKLFDLEKEGLSYLTWRKRVTSTPVCRTPPTTQWPPRLPLSKEVWELC